MDGAKLKSIMRHYPTGVTVVTTLSEEGVPYGLTVNSFTSVSLIPPLVLVCLDKNLSGLSLFKTGRHFAVNFLGEDQKTVSEIFAKKGVEDRFRQVRWAPGPHGLPILDGVLAFLACRISNLYEEGDHVVVIAEVVSGEVVEPSKKPLIYFRSSYFTIKEEPIP